MTTSQGTLSRAPRPSSLADVLDLILDKGLVIDAYVRVSAVGIEILTIDARIVIASVDTYLHFAEAVNRLDLTQTETSGLPGFLGNDSDNNHNGSDHQQDGSQGRRGSGGEKAIAGRSSGSGQRGQARDRRQSEKNAERDGESESGSGERSRQPSGLVRRLADRGKWEDE